MPQNSSGSRWNSAPIAASCSPRTTGKASRARPYSPMPEHDERVVVRPHRAVVVAHRVVDRVPRRTACGCPSRRTCRRRAACAATRRGLLRRRHPAPQQMPGVGGDGRHLALGAVERQRERAALLHPESLANPRRAARRASAASASARSGSAEAREQVGHAHLGVVDVALHLDQRDRRLRRAGRRGTTPRRPSPSTPGSTSPLRAGAGVLHEPVAVEIAVAVDPGQRPLGVRQQLLRPARRRRSSARSRAAAPATAASRRRCRSTARGGSRRPAPSRPAAARAGCLPGCSSVNGSSRAALPPGEIAERVARDPGIERQGLAAR